MAKELNMTDKVGKIEIKMEETTPIPSEDIKSELPKKKIFNKKIWLPILITFAVLLALGTASFYYFGIYKVKPYKKPSQVISLNSEYLIPQALAFEFSALPIPTPTEPRTEQSTLNGILFTKTEMKLLQTKRPVAVMTNNHVDARPQSGLNSADVVYEALAESGITRYMAIYWSQAPKKVGPIRSSRQYYIEWLSPYDPLYIYDGCADTENPKTDACDNLYKYDIKKIATIGAWRWNDGRRYAPHNEYSSVTAAWEYAQKLNWGGMPKIEAWKFKPDAKVEERGTRTKVKVTFYERLNNRGAYDTVWTYDSTTNSYLKETGGKIDIDQETNTQLFSKNVIIQEVTMTPTYDEKGRVIIDTIGEGKSIYLIDGKITEGRWKKIARTDRTTYYDKDGNEVQFNRGRVWITAMPRSQGKFAIIEQ